MHRSLTAAAVLLVWAALFSPAPFVGQTHAVPSIRQVQVLPTRNQVEIEIEASDRIVPHTNLLTHPDRLVVDFVNAVPGAHLFDQTVNRGEVKSLHVGLFSSNPPVTRVVLYLNGPQRYQVFPSGRTVIVKIGESAGVEPFHAASEPIPVNTSYSGRAVPILEPVPPPAKPPLEVSFHDGLLSIHSNKASLSAVLVAVREQTGAEIAIPAGAEQEMVVGNFGPAPAPEVLAHLLNGSAFNFLILSSSTDPGALDRVILSSRAEGPTPAPGPQVQPVPDEPATDINDAARVPPGIGPRARRTPPVEHPDSRTDGHVPPGAPPETEPPPTNDAPD
jgi:hypothetical protein